MFIHLGQDIAVLRKDIIGIFDLDTSTNSKRTRDYLAEAELKGDVVTITNELPKTFIVCRSSERKSGKILQDSGRGSPYRNQGDECSAICHKTAA